MAFLIIGIAHTRITITDAGTERARRHEQHTPRDVAKAKRRIHRNRSALRGDRHVQCLETYLRTLWDSFHLELIPHLVLLTDATDTPEYVWHAQRWVSAMHHSKGSFMTLRFPLYAAALYGVGSACVVVDVGYSSMRLVPLLHRDEVGVLRRYAAGVDTWSLRRTSLLEAYMSAELLHGDEAMTARLAEVEAWLAAASPEEREWVSIFVEGLEEAIRSLVQAARSRGQAEVLSTWVIVGGGAAIEAVRNVLAVKIEAQWPDAILIWS